MKTALILSIIGVIVLAIIRLNPNHEQSNLYRVGNEPTDQQEASKLAHAKHVGIHTTWGDGSSSTRKPWLPWPKPTPYKPPHYDFRSE